jgi:DMSO reductase anchor subunit
MHPAFSIIFFTVASGAGFGLVTLTIAFHLMGGLIGMPTWGILSAMALGVALAGLGLLSSTLHLASPQNAWRAFSRFRTSWLSREAVFAVLFFPIVGLYMLGILLSDGVGYGWSQLAGFIAMILAVATVFTTGMIYASLKTIPQWNSALVPTNYLLLSFASGSALLAAVMAVFGGPHQFITLVALCAVIVAALTKSVYYFWIGKPQGPTINTALGITRSRIRMLEPGQSSDSFLNKEFSFEAAVEKILRMRWAVYMLAFLAPLLVLILVLYSNLALLTVIVPVFMLAGLLAERWLFFAEARHVVNLYYGRQQV